MVVGSFLAIFAIFYFWHIASKASASTADRGIKDNDEVVTNGGIIGRIKEVRETSFIIQSADKSFLEIGKSAVVGKKAE